MTLLLDTSTLLWWATGSPSLSDTAKAAISQPRNTIYVRAATAWEISTKVRIGKLNYGVSLVDRFEAYCQGWGFIELPISIVHAKRAGCLMGPHKDPFDRMLAAQALVEDLVLVTNDSAMRHFGPKMLW